MKARRFREGKLTATEITDFGLSEINPDALGTIADLPDFLEKVRRLRQEIIAPPGSLRDGCVQQVEFLAGHVEEFLRGPRNSPAAEHALLYLLHCACQYMNLLAELADDDRHDPRKRITRSRYLAALHEHKTQEACAEALGISVQGLRKWRRANLGR